MEPRALVALLLVLPILAGCFDAGTEAAPLGDKAPARTAKDWYLLDVVADPAGAVAGYLLEVPPGAAIEVNEVEVEGRALVVEVLPVLPEGGTSPNGGWPPSPRSTGNFALWGP